MWYFTAQNSQQNQLGYWLGPAINLGQGLAYNVLAINAKIIVQSTVTSLSTAEKSYPAIITKLLMIVLINLSGIHHNLRLMVYLNLNWE